MLTVLTASRPRWSQIRREQEAINKRQVGSAKEQVAASYLKGLGYDIIKTNFFCKAGEIDIIARDEEYLCFIEVKYRASDQDGFPEEAVDYRKCKRITRSALAFMNMCGIPDTQPCRFDVVAIMGERLTLIKNAFDAVL